MKLKILAIGILLIMTCSTLITTASIDDSRIGSLDDSSCYGFIVPIVKLENKTLENDIDCRILNMINDFLREKITVYWTSENCTTSILIINGSEEQDMFFEKGTFIIPFTENNTIDKKIIAIVCDYNQTSEIEQDVVCIPIYELIEPLAIKAHKLSEAKIAWYVGSTTHDTPYYLIIATQCGFLDFDIIYSKEIEEKLILDNYNVIIWPGTETEKGIIYDMDAEWQEIKYNVLKTIREFVTSGGGYVGSCYGSEKSSILCFLPRVGLYLPTLGISGTIAHMNKPRYWETVGICKQKIVVNDHPVTYGLDQIVTDYYGNGPKLICIGKNTQALSLYQDCNAYLDNTPGWVSNTYGAGKVIAFSSHPEIIGLIQEGFNGKHVVCNTWYHLTNKGINDISCEHSVNLSIIDSVIENTSNLINISSIPPILFNDVLDSINNNISKMQEIKTIVEEIRDNKYSIGTVSDSIRKLSGNINRSIECFEKIPIILNSIEKVYTLSVSEVNFSEEIQLLIDSLILKLNNIEDIITKLNEDIEKAKYELDKYQNRLFPSKIKEFYIKDLLFSSLRNISEAYAEISQTYHESLKFLRHNWYDYETNLALSGL